MIKRELFDKIGLLSMDYGVGGGEDSAFCFEAENLGYRVVNTCNIDGQTKEFNIGDFPIYHKGEATVHDNPKWQEIFNHNSELLKQKYNENYKKFILCNHYERAVIGKGDFVPGLETARYLYANRNIVGKKILEIGCSSGYGTMFLPNDIDYTGVDYDEKIVQYAKSEFGDETHKFIHADINKFELGQYDTIIAYEVLEHLDNGRELAQELKKHCKKLICSCPYLEPKGFWGGHHKLHQLTEDDFPGMDEYMFVQHNGNVRNYPDSKFNLLLMKYGMNN